MTSCSYQHVSTTSLKRATYLHRQLRQFYRHANSPVLSNDVYAIRASSVASSSDEAISICTFPFPREEKEKANELKSDDYKLPDAYTLKSSSRPKLGNKLDLPHHPHHNSNLLDCKSQFVRDSRMKRNLCLVDKDLAGRIPEALCSPSQYHLENHNESLKSAPIVFRNVSGDKGIPAKKSGTHLNLEKGGESSWVSVLGWNKNFPTERITRLFHAVYNHQRYKDFIIGKGYKGKTTMSLALLLDPIIGSPPSNLSSPMVEARDDISALSEGFTRKVKIFRRRLSTSFDEPASNSEDARSGISGVSGRTANLENAGPLAFKSARKAREELEEDNADKKAKLNAWLSQLHEEALLKAQKEESSSDINESGGGDEAHDNDGSDGQSKPISPIPKTYEDLFQLLEKVIGFKGRNISHITVEQSVKDLCTVYMDVGEDDKLKFFLVLAEKYGVDHDNVSAVAMNLAACKDAEVRLTLEEKLRGALVPKSQWLFTQIGRLENGVKFLVDMRTDLLDAIERSQGKSSLKALNNSVRDLIGMWFNVGFLSLERVTWQSSCDMLQKVSEYEAVHPMRNWTDLKKRVGPNRRCFVYTHNSMPGEPVVVLHTFLTNHIPASIKKIVANQKMRMMSLDSELPMTSTVEDPDFISTAVFYSITSTQRGLTGIELGNYLIKRVVRELQSEFPKMTQYSSLSPIPGFTKWLASSIRNGMKDPSSPALLTKQEVNSLEPLFKSYSQDQSFYKVFLDLLKVNSWYSDESLVKALEKPLMRLCAQYLYIVKRRGYALDPVAHFHLKNGAVMWRLNWLGDESPRGLGQSCGMMVNYRYFLDACETNSQNYMENQVIQVSDQVKRLAKSGDSDASKL